MLPWRQDNDQSELVLQNERREASNMTSKGTEKRNGKAEQKRGTEMRELLPITANDSCPASWEQTFNYDVPRPVSGLGQVRQPFKACARLVRMNGRTLSITLQMCE